MDTSENLNIIPLLQDLAFNSFTDLVFKAATPETVPFIRGLIDQHLIGRVKYNFRKKCVTILNQFWEPNQIMEMQAMEKDLMVTHQFPALDCILDEHFEDLDIELPGPSSSSFPILMSIISQRSPNLKSLKVVFHGDFRKLLVFKSTHQNLDCLTQLFLRCYSNPGQTYFTKCDSVVDKPSILSYIGKYCPSLINLEVYLGFCQLRKKHLLDLILKRVEFNRDLVLEGLQVPEELLNPLCWTLQELTAFGTYSCGECYRSLTISDYAFTLRHLRNLREVETIEYLDDIFKKMMSSRTEFSGFSMMESFPVSISLSDRDLVKAAGSLCPRLKEVEFRGELIAGDREDPKTMTPQELEQLLSDWSLKEIDSVILVRVNPALSKPILNLVETTLTSLKLENSLSRHPVDLNQLASCCIKLKKLSLVGCIFLNAEDVDAASRWNSDTFLPLLTKFRSDRNTCLGVWSPLIERKSKLVELELNCCHIGTKVYNNPRLEWSEITKLWPNMKRLVLHQCSGLKMKMVSEIMPRLTKLQSIQLPQSVLSEDPELTKNIIEDFASISEKPIAIIEESIDNTLIRTSCSFSG